MASPADIQAATAAVAAGTQTAEQAALVNQSYLSNSLPVLPAVAPNASAQDYGQYSQYQREQVYNSNQQNNLILTWNTQGLTDPANQQGKAVYLTPTEYQQQYGATDAQREQVRYNIFNNPAAVNPNTVPADMQGLYGTQLRDQQSDYYRANPSEEFQRITQQYEANRYGSVGSGSNYTYNYGSSKNPFDPNSAAGIAWDVNRLGGTVGMTLGGKSYSEGYNAVVTDASDRSVVPTRLVGSGMVAGMSQGSQFVDDVDIYMAVGGYQGVRVPDAKLAVDYQTGEFGVYQKMGTHNIYGLVGGGGWNSLQSGMFSFGESLWDKEHTFAQSDIGSMAPVSSEYMSTHSKAGAEAYGGFSRLLTGNLLQSDDAVSRYGNWNNLANYAQPVAATKGAVKGADIPWTMDVNAPAAQYMDQSGLTGKTFDVSMPDSGRLVGSKMVASQSVVSDVSGSGIEGLPKPFMSASSPAEKPNEYAPSGFLGLGGLFPEMPSYDKVKGYSVNRISKFGSDPIGGMVDVTTDLYGAPMSLAGGLASRFTFGASEFIYKPEPTTSGTDKIYASEWDRFVEGSGRVARFATGMTLEKQEAYFETIKNAPGAIGEAQRGLFYFGTEIINKPAELAPAAILGWGIGGAARMTPGFLAEVGAGTGFTAKAANFLSTPGGSSLAKAGLFGAFGGAYTWGVTEGLTASADKTKENIYRSTPTLIAMYGGAGGFNWVGETTFVRGVSSPSGATFEGVQIQGVSFGGGKTPTGGKYVGAFSPTESYVFTGKPQGVSTGSIPAFEGGARLGLPDLSRPSVSKASGLVESAESYQYMDLSGRSRPFSVNTVNEIQVDTLSKFRDTSGRADPFTIRTESGVGAARSSAVHDIISDTSGGSPAFSVKTQAEVGSGYWDTAERFGGDVSGKSRSFSVTSENEYLSSLPSDVSGKADPFTMKTQGEIMSVWEQEKFNKAQTRADMVWARKTASNRVEPGFMEKMIDTEYSLVPPEQATATWKPWKPEMQPQTSAMEDPFSPLNPKRVYADAEPSRSPFSIPGVSDTALSTELAGMHPAYRGARAPFSIPGVSDASLAIDMARMHPAYSTPGRNTEAGITWGFGVLAPPRHLTRIEEEAAMNAAMPRPQDIINKRLFEIANTETGVNAPETGYFFDKRTGREIAKIQGTFEGISGSAKVAALTEIFDNRIDAAYYHVHTDVTGSPMMQELNSMPSGLDVTRKRGWADVITTEGVITSKGVIEWTPRQLHKGAIASIDRAGGVGDFVVRASRYGLKARASQFPSFETAPLPATATDAGTRFVPAPYFTGSTITENPSGRSRRTTEFVPYTGRDITDAPGSSTKRTTGIAPYFKTTPYESPYTKTKPFPEEKPYKWNTPTPPPPDITRKFPDYVPPIVPTGGLPWGGAGAESPFSRKRKAAFVETFNMGLDMGFLGRKGRASKSFTTPAKYKRKPAAVKPAKKAAPKKRK